MIKPQIKYNNGKIPTYVFSRLPDQHFLGPDERARRAYGIYSEEPVPTTVVNQAHEEYLVSCVDKEFQ